MLTVFSSYAGLEESSPLFLQISSFFTRKEEIDFEPYANFHRLIVEAIRLIAPFFRSFHCSIGENGISLNEGYF